MKASDWADPDNYRNKAIATIAEACLALGLDWSATEKKMTINLPHVKEVAVKPVVKTRKHFDVDKWGPKGVDESLLGFDDTMPNELPPTSTPLEEGEPPKGDEEV